MSNRIKQFSSEQADFLTVLFSRLAKLTARDNAGFRTKADVTAELVTVLRDAAREVKCQDG